MQLQHGLHDEHLLVVFQACQAFNVLQEPHHKLVPSMFPQEDVQSMNIERCMRVLPHHTEGGGFFVAVLHKKAEFQTDWSSINPNKLPRCG